MTETQRILAEAAVVRARTLLILADSRRRLKNQTCETQRTIYDSSLLKVSLKAA